MAKKTVKVDMSRVDREGLAETLERRRMVLMDVRRIEPNDYNKNKMGAQYKAALKAALTNNHIGFTQPILVRPDPELYPFDEALEKDRDGTWVEGLIADPEVKWVIIDGEHRYREALEIGYPKIPCVCFPPIPQSLARFLTDQTNRIHGATKDEHILAALDEVFRSGDSWLKSLNGKQEEELDLHAMMVIDAPEFDSDKYGLEDSPIEQDHQASVPVTLFFSEVQRDKFRKVVGQLRLVHGMTNEEAIDHIIQHFVDSTGFGEIQKEAS